MIALAAVTAVAGVVSLASASIGAVIGPLLLPVVSLFTGIAGIREARLVETRQARTAWLVISYAFLSAAVGLATFVAVAPFVQINAFGPPDVPIALGYVMLMVGITMIPSVIQERTHRIRVVIDALVGAISLIAVSWVLFLDGVWAQLSDAPAWDRTFGSLYPVLDLLMIIVAMAMFLRRSSRRFDIRFGLIGLGLALQTTGDLVFVIAGAGKKFTDAEPNFGFFLLAFSCYAVVSVMIRRRAAEREFAKSLREPVWPLLAPYAMAIAMLGVLVATMASTDTPGQAFSLLIATIIVGLLVILRQLAAIRENREHVERERRALISTISHELRTPLTAMVGFLDLVNSDDVELEESERREMIDVVDKQARYLSRIVSDLVLLARGKADEMDLERTDTHIAEIIARSITSLDTGLNDARVLVSPELIASVDDNRILQALVNLLSNAVRYGGDDRAVVATARGGHLTIEVHDSGPGVPVRHQLSIWERFERGANRLNAAVPGSGIGLAIVRAIAEAHGGTVGYRPSELLEGACFFMALPDCVVAAGTGPDSGPANPEHALPAPGRPADSELAGPRLGLAPVATGGTGDQAEPAAHRGVADIDGMV